jgi:monoamine oxidase
MAQDISRRQFVHWAAQAGGVAAAYSSMVAMGLLPMPDAYAGPPQLPAGSGQGTRVTILGAGMAGMISAYELGKVGYDCLVLEARSRAGGRNWSLSRGDTVEEANSSQTVGWDPGTHMYFNPGPARIPSHHQGILSYCREFDVPVEVMINDNRGALLHDDNAFLGRPQVARAVINDGRGFVAELAAKAVSSELMSQSMTQADKKRILEFLTAFGDLDEHLLTYRGSERSGYAIAPGACDDEGIVGRPIDFWQLLASDFWTKDVFKMHFGEHYHQAATMLQPVGGMGRIGEAIGRKLGSVIRYNAEVTGIEKTPSGVRTIWRGPQNTLQANESKYLICTIPLPVLRNIATDFSSDVKAAIASVPYVPAGKIAFQAERRFWELDHQIYGGISWTTRPITQIWYPSAGLHQKKGIVVGGYIWDKAPGETFARNTPKQRIADAIADGAHVHPNWGSWLTNGVSVAWPNIPYSQGGWASWDSTTRSQHYPTLLKGDHEGRILFAGEHVSYLNGWQEGAVLSAHCAIEKLAAHMKGSAN